jgi:hypothetical protein
MKQSKWASWLESISSTAVGFGISLVAQIVFLPLLGVTISLTQNFTFAMIMTAISVARGYIMRRIFEHFGIRAKLSPFAQAVIAERKRQIEVEGWSHEHDDRHEEGDLASAGACYAQCAGVAADDNKLPPSGWLWDQRWWKPVGFRRDLVKACALIIAEGERFDRNRKRPRSAVVEAIRTVLPGVAP